MLDPTVRYQLKTPSKFFMGMVAGGRPYVTLKGTDREVLGCNWERADQATLNGYGSAVAMYRERFLMDKLPFLGTVYVGEMSGMKVLIHESEIDTPVTVH